MNHIHSLFLYPFKSLAACQTNELEFMENSSLRNDRKWMLADKEMNFLTQRHIPSLSLFSVKILPDNKMQISYKSASVEFPFVPEYGDVLPVKVWDRKVNAFKPHDSSLSDFFSDCLHQKVYPLFFPDSKNELAHRSAAFSDSSPVLVISLGSMKALNEKFAEPFSPIHFRPNIILSSEVPFIEDQAMEIIAGEISLKFLKLCSRCIMVNVIPSLGFTSTSGEPLKTLAGFRRSGDSGKVNFGGYFSPTAGVLKTGMPYSIISHE